MAFFGIYGLNFACQILIMVADLSNAAAAPSRPPAGRPLVLPVASGKGGVGKSFLAANLAVALAARGRRTIVCDLDFGGASLHRFLGLRNRHPGLSEVLCGHVADLEELAVETPWPGLRFLPGDGRTPLLANLPGARKAKLIRQIARLAADVVVLDLGAGSSLTTLDFFGMTEAGLLVATPDAAALEGMLVFLKNSLHRRIETRLAAWKNPALRRLLKAEREKSFASQAFSLEEFAARLSGAFPPAADEIRSLSAALRPRVVLNRALRDEDIEVTRAVEHALRVKLGVTPEFYGFFREDPAVADALRRGRAFLADNPSGPTAEALHRLAGRIDRFWERRVPDTAERLARRLIRIPARPPDGATPKAERRVSVFGRAVRIFRGLRP